MPEHGPRRRPYAEIEAILRGHVLAHELGHLLLGAHSYSDAGTMSFPWNKKQMLAASRETLRFKPEAAQRIRETLIAGGDR